MQKIETPITKKNHLINGNVLSIDKEIFDEKDYNKYKKN